MIGTWLHNLTSRIVALASKFRIWMAGLYQQWRSAVKSRLAIFVILGTLAAVLILAIILRETLLRLFIGLFLGAPRTK